MVQHDNFTDKAAQIGNGIQYTGATGSIICGLALNEIGVIVGIIIAIFGFFVNWYYKHKSYLLLMKKVDINLEDINE